MNVTPHSISCACKVEINKTDSSSKTSIAEIKNTDNTIIQERLLSYLTISNASAVVTPQEAASSCRHEIGYQWNVPFNHADNKKLLNDFAKQFANLMGHTITDTNFIVAGKYDIQKLSWKMRKGDVESYAKIATTNTPQHGDCLLGKVTLKNEWIWNPVKCYSSIQNAQVRNIYFIYNF